MAKLGFRLQLVGFALAAAAYLLIWLLRPHVEPGPIPPLSPDGGPYKPAHVTLAFGLALAVIGLASLRWPWAGLALVLVAIPAAWYALTNHALQWTRVALVLPITYSPVVVVGTVMSIAGLAIRILSDKPQPKAQV
jgi:hypothetical protein